MSDNDINGGKVREPRLQSLSSENSSSSFLSKSESIDERIKSGEVELRVGQPLSHQDLNFYEQFKQAEVVKDRLDSFATADSFGDAVKASLISVDTGSNVDTKALDYVRSTLPKADYTEAYPPKSDVGNGLAKASCNSQLVLSGNIVPVSESLGVVSPAGHPDAGSRASASPSSSSASGV